MKTIRTAFILSMLVALTGCSPPVSTVTSAEGGYTVKMPSFFVAEAMLPVKTALGTVNYRLVGSDPTRIKKFWPFWSRHGPYVVAHADFPQIQYSQQDIGRLFDYERERLLGQAQGAGTDVSGRPRITFDNSISLQGHPGREVRIMFSDDRYSQARMYFVEGRFYVLYGVGKNLDDFFNSFTLTG